MPRPYFSVKHVQTYELLPEKLTPGRIYFIDDEQVIVIDHGNGLPPVIYGGRPGPQGASGEPQPQLQDQIDELASASLQTHSVIWQEAKKRRYDLRRIEESISEKFTLLRELTDRNSQAILNLSSLIQKEFENYDSAIAILSKTVANLYPDQTHDDDDTSGSDDTGSSGIDTSLLVSNLSRGDAFTFNGETLSVNKYSVASDGSISMSLNSAGAFSDKSDPLDDEQVDTELGSYTIQQTNALDGSTVLDLTANPSLAQTLNDGDTVSSGGENYTVSNYSKNDDGSISLTLN